MSNWNQESLEKAVFRYKQLTALQQQQLQSILDQDYPFDIYTRDLTLRRKAIENMSRSRKALENIEQCFPEIIDSRSLPSSPSDISGYAIVFTAGGEGERLRLSLLKQGIAEENLIDFTKATYPLADFVEGFGTLQANLAIVSDLCRSLDTDIPVIITTGPEGSITERVIPQILKNYGNFGLRSLRVIAQNERLHFTADELVAWKLVKNVPVPVTQPDETGGPLMRLKQKTGAENQSTLEWIFEHNCDKILVVQGTALYDQRLLPLMASALKQHDGLAVGILRSTFAADDPFGTIVTIKNGDVSNTLIVEQDVRNEQTRSLIDSNGHYLPCNTGFYGITVELLMKNDLPDYATPPKEVLPGIPRSPKIGYAATDLLPLAKNPVILAIDPSMYGVIKTVADIEVLSELGKRFGLQEICSEVARTYKISP